MNPLPFNGPWMLTDVSERMNAFPTHTLAHIPLGELAKHQLNGQYAHLLFSGQLHGSFFGKKSVLSVLCINSIVFEVENPGWVIYTYLVQIALIPGGTAPCHWIVFIIKTAKGGIFFGILNFEGREQNLPQRLPCRP